MLEDLLLHLEEGTTVNFTSIDEANTIRKPPCDRTLPPPSAASSGS